MTAGEFVDHWHAGTLPLLRPGEGKVAEIPAGLSVTIELEGGGHLAATHWLWQGDSVGLEFPGGVRFFSFGRPQPDTPLVVEVHP